LAEGEAKERARLEKDVLPKLIANGKNEVAARQLLGL